MKTIFYQVLFSLVCALTFTVASCSDDEGNATSLSAPGDIRYNDISDHSFKVSWTADSHANGYIVKLRDEWGELKEKEQTVFESFANFTGLNSEQKYWVSICAITANGSQASPFSAWAAVKMQEGAIAKAFAYGEGIMNYPFVIKTPGQLKLMAYLVNKTNEANENGTPLASILNELGIETDPTIDYTRAYYELGANIDMSKVTDWTPIGTGADNEYVSMPNKNMFMGNLDGKGYTISNFNIEYTTDNRSGMFGLFGLSGSGCKVSNLNLKGNITVVHTGETTPNGNYLQVGGIMGYNNKSTIINCSYEGSIHASFRTDGTGTIMLGGICGGMSGSVSECSVIIPTSGQMTGYAQSPQVGAVVGFGNSGMLTLCTAVIDGTLLAETRLFNENASLDDVSAFAGGICASAGGTSIGGCKVTINGSITARSKRSTIEGITHTAAFVGGVAGAYGADILGNCEIIIKGSVKAEADNLANAGGAIGSQSNAGYGCAALHAIITGEVKATSSAARNSTDTSYAGGLYGSGRFQTGTASMQDSDVILSGNIIAEHPRMAVAGGIAGSFVGLTRCWATINEGAVVLAQGGTAGAVSGGLVGISTGNTYASYTICKGTIKALSSTAGNNSVNVGGVLGAATGTRTLTRIVTGCYSLLEGALIASGNVKNIGGVIGMGSAYTRTTATYWWSASSDIKGHTGTTPSIEYKMPDNGQSSLERAAEDMNAKLTTQYGYYFYREKDHCLNMTPYM